MATESKVMFDARVSTSCPERESRPSDRSERPPSALRPPAAIMDVELVSVTPPRRPVRGKAGFCRLHAMAWHDVDPGCE